MAKIYRQGHVQVWKHRFSLIWEAFCPCCPEYPNPYDKAGTVLYMGQSWWAAQVAADIHTQFHHPK